MSGENPSSIHLDYKNLDIEEYESQISDSEYRDGVSICSVNTTLSFSSTTSLAVSPRTPALEDFRLYKKIWKIDKIHY
jgi:hypothetical protein